MQTLPKTMFKALLSAMLLAAIGNAQEEVRRALLIGINDYASADISDLKGCVNDVHSMRDLLCQRFEFDVANVRMLCDGDATRSRILDSIRELVQSAGPSDSLWIHYAGHGSQVTDFDGDETDGKDETLVPHDARAEGIADITDDELNSMLSGLACKRVVVVLDSCHSGTGTRSIAVRGRCAPPDKRDALYSKRRTRSIIAEEGRNHVFMSGAASHETALDGPVPDGRSRGAFSFSLQKAMAASPIDATPRQIFAMVGEEIRRLGGQWNVDRMPDPQLEAPEQLLSESLFAPSPRDTETGEPPATVSEPAAADAVADPTPEGPGTPIHVRGRRAGDAASIESELRQHIPGIRCVGPEEFASLVVDFGEQDCAVFGADGVHRIAAFSLAETADPIAALSRILRRAENAMALSAFENRASSIRLEFDVGAHDVPTPTPGSRGIKVVADTAMPTYRTYVDGGERNRHNSLQLNIRVDRDCFLTVVDVDAEGAINMLWPNDHTKPGFLDDGVVKAGTPIKIPDSLASGNRAGFHWDVGPPAGLDTIQVFASTDLETAEKIRSTIRGLASDERASARVILRGLRQHLGHRGIKVRPDSAGDGSQPKPAEAKADPVASVIPEPNAAASAPQDWATKSITIRITN